MTVFLQEPRDVGVVIDFCRACLHCLQHNHLHLPRLFARRHQEQQHSQHMIINTGRKGHECVYVNFAKHWQHTSRAAVSKKNVTNCSSWNLPAPTEATLGSLSPLRFHHYTALLLYYKYIYLTINVTVAVQMHSHTKY